MVNNQAQLQPGEDIAFDILLDPSRKLAQSAFFGSSIQLKLQKLSIA
jgi:hypothetical protein